MKSTLRLGSYEERGGQSIALATHLEARIAELELALESLERRRYLDVRDVRLRAAYRRQIRAHRSAVSQIRRRRPDGASERPAAQTA